MIRLTLILAAAGALCAGCSEPHDSAPAVSSAQPAIVELVKNDIAVGTGEAITAGQIAVVHYTGWLYDPEARDHRGKKFDSSRDRGQPFRFAVGAGSVIEGWDQGVQGMSVGGRRELIVPAGLGYGNRGAGRAIPPGATLLFDIELLAIEPVGRR